MMIKDLLNWNTIEKTFEASNDSVLIVDRNGVLYYSNKAYDRLLGVPNGYVKEKFWGLSLFDLNTFSDEVMKAFITGEPLIDAPLIIEKAGIEIIISIIPIKEEGEVKAAIVIGNLAQVNELLSLLLSIKKDYQQNKASSLLFKPKHTLPDPFKIIIGHNVDLIKTLLKATAVARTDASVLIEGENGTGKELLAKAIHESSSRYKKPFVVVNCAAIPEPLVESELFGYEPNSFTGASNKGKVGLFEVANGGTIFLDEIGDLSLYTQAKILRAVENRQIEKIGRSSPISIDLRIISATNKKLDELVENNKFRRDLYYRINVISINLPTLHERKREDLFLLCDYFLDYFSQQHDIKKLRFSPDAIVVLYQHNWPGNIRELKNAVEHSLIMADSEKSKLILPRHLPSDLFGDKVLNDYSTAYYHKIDAKEPDRLSFSVDQHSSLKVMLKSMERKIIKHTLMENNNDIKETASKLGISRAKLYNEINSLNQSQS